MNQAVKDRLGVNVMVHNVRGQGSIINSGKSMFMFCPKKRSHTPLRSIHRPNFGSLPQAMHHTVKRCICSFPSHTFSSPATERPRIRRQVPGHRLGVRHALLLHGGGPSQPLHPRGVQQDPWQALQPRVLLFRLS